MNWTLLTCVRTVLTRLLVCQTTIGTTELNMATASNRDPRHHTQKMLKAMFETSAEVLGGLCKAFRDSECKNEAAWR